MNVLLSGITPNPKAFDLPGDTWIPAEVAAEKGVSATATLRRLDNSSWWLTGRLQMTFVLSCDRCACQVLWPVDDEFHYRLVAADEVADGEVDEKSLDLWPLFGPMLNLAEVFCERVFLAMPEKVLCAEECRGLCPLCGADLNREPCRCS
ncbi:MAG: DUF177 domain-containing protein [Desulfobulbaceae bacterium]|jgi:uncharacterized metal-binding protein YceD (DUF177 family)|nr:DUF177 domain-containing protein [Desulfobulbaceae bacterium]